MLSFVSPSGIETAAKWLGSPSSIKYAMDFVDATDWAHISDLGRPHGAVRRPADGYYKTLAQNLVASGFGSSYIRLGWEFNASSMGWSICNQDGSAPTSYTNGNTPKATAAFKAAFSVGS